MISLLKGTLAARSLDHCVVDVGGVGFRLAMPSGSLAALPEAGDPVIVHTYLHVRPEELALYGFRSEEERSVFERLLTVSGVGPKVALAALSTWPAATLVDAIVSEDVAAISSVPGVGVKTARRIILELKDSIDTRPSDAGGSSPRQGALAETRDALLAMGFSAEEASMALVGLSGEDDSTHTLKRALRRLAGGA